MTHESKGWCLMQKYLLIGKLNNFMTPQAFMQEEEKKLNRLAMLKPKKVEPEFNQASLQASKVVAKVAETIGAHLPKNSELLSALQDAQNPKNILNVQFVRA
ncbi:hypothetical protein HYT84_01895 [Candidatus Micrarchaeota archaeon]|nr:hypothetical protein [Candidatus Micrarchaeota archaeon]